jgi:thiamine transporter ThiT
MKKPLIKNMILSGFFIALGLVLPFLTMQIPSIGMALLPMHIPVLIAGFVCGGPYGFIVGLIIPVLRSLLFGMPPLFPTAVAMTFELAAYGFMAGFLYKLLPKKNLYIYAALILSMISGRIVWGIASVILYGISGSPFGFEAFIGGAVINAIPGIIIQIVIIPVIIIALKKAKLIDNEK